MQFSSKSFKATLPNTLAAKYRKALQKHPFALFGLPFLATIVAGSFLLTPATALRYERYDRKNQQISQEEAMGLGQNRRKVNMKDEYYVSGPPHSTRATTNSWKTARRCCACTDNHAEITGQGLGGLGAEACQTSAWRARWYACLESTA
jgi:cytochrome c oxidase assembly protein subunit 16